MLAINEIYLGIDIAETLINGWKNTTAIWNFNEEVANSNSKFLTRELKFLIPIDSSFLNSIWGSSSGGKESSKSSST